MKRMLLNILLCIVLILFLTSCNNETNLKSETEPSNTVKNPSYISQTESTGQNEVKQNESSSVDIDNIVLNKNLCAKGEKLVFSFKVKNSNKKLSICISEEKDYIVYRYGTENKVEMEFPNDKTDSWEHFSYAYYLRAGGKENCGLDLNHITFQIDNYIYDIYDDYSAEEDCSSVGVIVTNSESNNKTEITGISGSKIGSLIDFRENSKIKQIDSWF